MNDFAPYIEEEKYKVILTKDEALLIQKIREVGYGAVTVHVVAAKIVRTETTSSELTRDRKKELVTIAIKEV